MASLSCYSVFFLLLLLFSCFLNVMAAKQTYIVHMKHHHKPSSFATHHDWYVSHLQSLSSHPSSLLYTYTTAYHGFAASLDPDQAKSLRLSYSVLGVYQDSVYHLHTTRTPKFLGLDTDHGLWAGHPTQDLDEASENVIIGFLDTGIWPESKSFDDSGMAQVPSRWRGQCESGVDFSPSLCNRKLIGARSFSKGYLMASGGKFKKEIKEIDSPRDQVGHGTHTTSTAAGSPVVNASFLGYANGTARGMATRARVASYKVCWSTGCFGSDVLAAMDRAIADGVDILSLSLGSKPQPYYRDPIAIGTFTALEMGIFVSSSGGNTGPGRASVVNAAPWMTTVGAGTLDRDFPGYIQLGNGKRFVGVGLDRATGMGSKAVGLVYDKTNSSSSFCLPGSLEPGQVRGKVVLCGNGINERVEKGEVVRAAGGLGMILAHSAASGEVLVADCHMIPAVSVEMKVGDMIREYVVSDPNPTVLLSFGGTVLNVRRSPVVAAFSSRGPNTITPQILKPDLIGPGVNILAGWSDLVGPTGLAQDTMKTRFNIMSGTSMSCPHISGVAALLKAAHPDWSPTAIKSALMTTAYTHDNTKSPLRDAAGGGFSTPWAHGSGHVDPRKALSPGLVYDATLADYIALICSLDNSTDHVQAITKRPNVTCSRRFKDPVEFNYPSFSVSFEKTRWVVEYTRELTNVGAASSTYNVTVCGSPSVEVKVTPTRLVFREVGEKLRYTVTFVAKKGMMNRVETGPESGWIVWGNEQYQVRSPVSYEWTQSQL
ncbi:subtilisin-like protease SBT1.8 isoform X2 [Telopea speciosissima]|uniref:subtilisin-like protease SBT1.8 isoform X1 n=1 Tax=Telopea speciosissima TaxID=54955 RepID=UPI001CC415DF|nr:subtilisin-like protease SBT1.8 isoform X1 [Telopea speciosissima]XP_043720412.1 subtilisin-like protease SBT1.8 isoform X2 [Telopea speciosissima]